MTDFQRVCSIYEICSAIETIHTNNIIYCDLKPENIWIDKNHHVCISNLYKSFINEFDDEHDRYDEIFDFDEISEYLAPEIIDREPHYNNKIDVYSFGTVLLFILIRGELPRLRTIEIFQGIPILNHINIISASLIKRCCSIDPNNRPSFTEIIEYIKANKFMLIDGVEKQIADIEKFLSL